MSIYTKTGDDGTTALFGGKRVLKCEELVDVYGSVDELNSWIGLIISILRGSEWKSVPKDTVPFLTEIQRDLFAIGSVMAGWNGDLDQLQARVAAMEHMIDAMDVELAELTNFILPGGSFVGSYIHIARAITRRVERQYVKLVHSSEFIVDPTSLKLRGAQQKDSGNLSKDNPTSLKLRGASYQLITMYLNRLSDLLFTLARYINSKQKSEEEIWQGIKR